MSRIIFMNSPILTNYGEFAHVKITVAEVIRLLNLNENDFESAIGHEATAECLSLLLSRHIPVNRQEIVQTPKDILVCFKLNRRLEQGVVITSLDELNEIGYTLSIITCIELDQDDAIEQDEEADVKLLKLKSN